MKILKSIILPIVVLAILSPAALVAAAERPNIVYILADDMGIGEISCYNTEGKIPTPHVDALARQGMKFMDAHTGSSVCTPTRYGILTGRYAWRTSLKDGGSRRGVNEQKSKPVINSADHLLFDMQKDESETTNLLHQHPEVVESLKKEFANVIKAGRSTPGVPGENDPIRKGETWTQIDILDEYLK